MAISAKLPSRLHHTAYTSYDLEATRHFYEDIIGLPLVATWCESDELFGKERTYCHCFFGLGDGGALAFFQFAEQGRRGAVRAEDAAVAVPPHRAERRCGDPGGHREAAEGGWLHRAEVLRARARLLPLDLCRGPERHDLRVHARPSGGRRRSTRRARPTRTANSSAGSPATTTRTTCSARTTHAAQRRPHTHDPRRQPAALAGGHRRAVRP